MITLRCIFVILFFQLTNGTYELSDESIYKITWNGDRSTSTDFSAMETIIMSTSVGEKYECLVPLVTKFVHPSFHSSNFTNNEDQVLEHLFKSQPCNTRDEIYWSYELCHGKHVRQFHEDFLPDKSSRVTEYYLGYLVGESHPISSSYSTKPPEILLGKLSYPYFRVDFGNGTQCDLTNSDRMTSVLYICLESEEGRIVQVSETQSCQYQIIFATKYLCAHPAYVTPKHQSIPIFCVPRAGSLSKPTSLLQFEEDKRQLSHSGLFNLAALFSDGEFKNIQIETERRDNTIVYRIRAQVTDSVSTTDTGFPDSRTPDVKSYTSSSELSKPNGPSRVDANLASYPAIIEQLSDFLRGHFCLTGQTAGWWMHEICFGKNVTQFHQDTLSKRSQVILLGKWNPEAHQRWMVKNPPKSSSQGTTRKIYRDLFYGNGDYCEQIDDNRETLVRMRCDHSAHGIYLSFDEQRTCRYVVRIESTALCEMSEDDWNNLVY